MSADAIATVTRLPVRPGTNDLTPYTVPALLDAIEVLTHKIHGATNADQRTHLRAQRELARDEVLRRTERSAGA